MLENVDDENNVSTAEEILTDYNERMEPKRKRTIMAIIWNIIMESYAKVTLDKEQVNVFVKFLIPKS